MVQEPGQVRGERANTQRPPTEPCCHLPAASTTQRQDTRIYSAAAHDRLITIQPATNFRLWLEVHAYSNPGAHSLCIFEFVTGPCFTPTSSKVFLGAYGNGQVLLKTLQKAEELTGLKRDKILSRRCTIGDCFYKTTVNASNWCNEFSFEAML